MYNYGKVGQQTGKKMNKTLITKSLFTKSLACAIFAASLLIAPTQSLALGGDDAATTPTCKTGYVYSTKKKKCVRKKSEIFPDVDLKKQGWKLAYAGKYNAAIELFDLVANKADPESLNGLGYSHRKLGKLTDGIAFYQKALKINPDYLLAREYLGEGYVAAGRINLAKEQLAEIEQRCGKHCKEYTLLAKVIATGKSSSW